MPKHKVSSKTKSNSKKEENSINSEKNLKNNEESKIKSENLEPQEAEESEKSGVIFIEQHQKESTEIIRNIVEKESYSVF